MVEQRRHECDAEMHLLESLRFADCGKVILLQRKTGKASFKRGVTGMINGTK
jgi:hypothetical protein